MEPKQPNVNTSVTSESGSKASEDPVPGSYPEVVVEPPAAKTREKAAKEVKRRQRK